MIERGLLRLASVRVPGGAIDLEAQLDLLDTLESEYRTTVASHLQSPEGAVSPADFFRWSDDLRGILSRIDGLEHWDAMESQRIMPRLAQALQALDRHLTGDIGEEWHRWRARYVPELQKALAEIGRAAAEKSRAVTAMIAQVIDPLLPPERRGESLSRKALWVVASTPGVSSVLVGLRSPAYVEDAAAVLSWPPLPDPLAVYRAIRERGPQA
jgi:hypothetical protein